MDKKEFKAYLDKLEDNFFLFFLVTCIPRVHGQSFSIISAPLMLILLDIHEEKDHLMLDSPQLHDFEVLQEYMTPYYPINAFKI